MNAEVLFPSIDDERLPAGAGRSHEHSRARPAAAELNERANRVAADAFFVIPAGGAPAKPAIDPAAETLSENEQAAALIVNADDRLALRCWRELPPLIAALAWPWTRSRSLCIRKAAWQQTGCRDVPDPLWDWTVRVARAGRAIACIEDDSAGRGGEFGPLDVADLPLLAPRGPAADRASIIEELRSCRLEELVPRVASPPDGVAILAGLWQLHDGLDESHAHSQSIEGQGRHRAGDYWHAIMHRREPDDSNAKYWFRRVGRHPVFHELAPAADAVLARCGSAEASRWRQRLGTPAGWDPLAFVDLCAHCRRSSDPQLETAARQIQLVEMLVLLVHTYRDAAGIQVG